MSPVDDDLAARNRLVEEHADLAEHFARRYAGRGLARDDLRQMALLAMVKAADRFEPERGVAFATFASRTIDGELKRQFRDRSWSVRPPRALQELHLTLRKVDEELTQELGRQPKLSELAERLEVGEEDVLEALEAGAAHRADSLDAPLGDGERTASDKLGVGDVGFGRAEGRMIVEDLLATLPERERSILELRFYDNLSQEEIAERIGVSQSYLSRLLRRTLLDLRAPLPVKAAAVLARAKAVQARMKADNVSLLSAAVAFWAMLALVPALVALVSLYGLVADPADVARQVRDSTESLPPEAQELIVSQLQSVVDAPAAGLGTGLVIGIAVALWAASAGMRTLVTAVGVVYGDQAGDRGFVAERGQALALTLGSVAFVAVGVAVVALLPADNPVVWVLRWPVLGAAMVLGIGALYRLAPASRPAPRLLTPGAVTAAVLWVVVSLLFSTYTTTFGSYNETYGSLAAVVILLLWLQLSAMAVLIGAELNQVLRSR